MFTAFNYTCSVSEVSHILCLMQKADIPIKTSVASIIHLFLPDQSQFIYLSIISVSRCNELRMLLSAADVKACMFTVQSLNFGEEACYNGTLMVKAFSSGLEIGLCNWSITGPKGSIAYISSSVFSSTITMGFDYKALQSSDVILYSDISSCNGTGRFDDDSNCVGAAGNNFSNLRCFFFSIAVDYGRVWHCYGQQNLLWGKVLWGKSVARKS